MLSLCHRLNRPLDIAFLTAPFDLPLHKGANERAERQFCKIQKRLECFASAIGEEHPCKKYNKSQACYRQSGQADFLK